MQKFIYFFDFMSPYSYFSFHNPLFKEIKNKVSVEFRPVVLARLLSHYETKGPGEIEPIRNFLLRQCFRYAQKNNFPHFTTPKNHPFNPLYALRLAAKSCAEESQEKVIETIWKMGWEEGLDLGDPDTLVTGLNRAGLEGDKLMEKTFDRTVKKEIMANTELALSHGVFGVPSFIYQDELFWGNDALSDVLNTINNQDMWNRKKYEDVIENTKGKI